LELAFEMKHITKTYPDVVANDDVSVSAAKGSVLCVIGENGAGKSTLMNILYGMTAPDAGEIRLHGEAVRFASSRDAMKHKVGMVFQHFMLVEELTCLENIIIGMEPVTGGLVLDRKRARTQIEEIMRQYNMHMPLDTPAGELWVGVQQKLEILKTLYRGAEIIILDEPTAVLTPQETQELFVNVRKLAEKGKTIIFITHKLDEVMQTADHIVVMRAGRVVAELKSTDTNVHDLSVHMVGSEIPPMRERTQIQPQAALRLNRVSHRRKNGVYALKDVDMTLHKGEILGIAGISGNGQVELAQIVSGLTLPHSGQVTLGGEDITGHDRLRRIRDGISYIPEDRTTTGVCLSWSIEDNCFAGYQEKFVGRLGVLDRKKTGALAMSMIEKFRVKTPGRDVPIRSLSGGNMQKVVVARETGFGAQVIIAAEPSRGVDIGAISTIHNHMIALRNEGCAILLISSSLDEIFALSDRIAVMFEGEVTAVLDPKTTSREEIGLYMSGAKRQEKGDAV